MMTSARRVVVATLVGAALASTGACMRSKEKSQDPSASLSSDDKKELDDYMAEVEIGRNMAGRLLGYYGAVEDESLLGYVNQIGNYVASYGDFPDRRYMFAILKHESVNAFACPGGYILITMGAIRAATNEAELAAVLGHETAHVGKKHMFTTLKAMKEKELETTAKTGEAEMPEALRVRERPKTSETGAGAVLARYLSGSTGASLNILQAAQAGMTLITVKGLDKTLEFEADHEGVKYAIRAGYSPGAMIDYLKRLTAGVDEKKLKNLERTHPSVDERVDALKKLLKSLKASDIIGATGDERFAKAKKTFPKPE